MARILKWFANSLRLPVAMVLVMVLAVACNESGALARDSGELDLDPTHAPYQADVVHTVRFQSNTSDRMSYMLADLEGDGNLELLTGSQGHLLGLDCEDGYVKPRFQINLAAGWNLHHQANTRLGVATDLNGDNISEVHVTVVNSDRSAWRFQTFDLATGKMIVDVPLPLGVDRRPDGIWDGSYMPMGVLADADGRGTTGIVLLRNAGYDANPRGLLVVDARTGEPVWSWQCGPNPDGEGVVVADVDGDDVPEIILACNSPDNLGKEPVNGLSDDRAYLFVVSNTGREMWRQELGPALVHCEAQVADLDGDGRSEIITYTGNSGTGQSNSLVVWDYSQRRRLVTQRQEVAFMGLAVLAGPRPGTSWLVTGSNDGFVTRYVYDHGHLRRDGRCFADFRNCMVSRAVDILPEPGREFTVSLGRGEVFAVLGTNLEPLAVLKNDPPFFLQSPTPWRMTEQTRALVAGNTDGFVALEFTPTPFVMPAWARTLAGGLLLLALLAGAYVFGRSRGRRAVPAAPPVPALSQVADREVLYRVWRQLDDVKHERFLEANRGLRRLVWLLEAYTADLGASESLGIRIGQLLDDFNNSVQPRLLEILRLANTEKFETAAVARAAEALERLGTHLGNLDVEALTMESVQERGQKMSRDLQDVESGFLHLWQSLRRYFSTDPVRMLQGMLLVREVEFERAGVETRLVGQEKVSDPVCLIDSSSLRFMLDNLVENALRAMSDAERKVLEVRFERTAKELVLWISDTGRGIPVDRQESIFNGRTSDRPGGGAGLYRTREILQRWRGEIQIDRSLSGQGTTFVVKLRAANELDDTVPEPRALQGEA